jgi:GMP synthase-like glutamine amidotransferase
MRIHCLQHVPFEDAANIGLWAREQGHTLTATRLYEDEPLPDPAEIDLLAIMGGPMNIYQYRHHPWLTREKVFLERALAASVPSIGVCLGAQLLADVLGARITQNPWVEIGWHTVRLTAKGSQSPFFSHVPPEFTAFHWHGDTFEIPSGATRLAESDACCNQAFQYGLHVLGLQFHLEYSVDSIETMLAKCGDELTDGVFVQTADRIRAGYHDVVTIHRLLVPLLNHLARE